MFVYVIKEMATILIQKIVVELIVTQEEGLN